jgi:hypothetical protein
VSIIVLPKLLTPADLVFPLSSASLPGESNHRIELGASLTRSRSAAIMNIFALWLVLFLAYAIFYMEVFGLTKWGSAGSTNSNYSSFFKALVLLALQSTG